MQLEMKSEYTVVMIKVTKIKIKPVFQQQTSLFNKSAKVWGMHMFIVHFKRLTLKFKSFQSSKNLYTREKTGIKVTIYLI